MKQRKGFFTAFLLALAGMNSCDTIDCTLNNIVEMRCNFYQNGNSAQLNDTLTITAIGTDEVLLNRKYMVSTFVLPLSYFNPEDTLVLTVKGEDYVVSDTMWITKTSFNHFESPDCPVNMFHDITAVRTTHLFIDSVTITHSDVNFSDHENLQIHFYPSAD